MMSSFQAILLKNSKDQVSKLEQELNFGKLTPPCFKVLANGQFKGN
jgi:hypothetical protein